MECESTKSTLRWVVSRKKLDQAAINCRPFILPASVRAHLVAQAPVAAQHTNSSFIGNRWQQTAGLRADRVATRVRKFTLPAALSGRISTSVQAASGNSSTSTEPEQAANRAEGGNSSTSTADREPPSGNIATRAAASKGESAASTIRIATPDFQYADMALMPLGTLAKHRGGGHRTAERNSCHAPPNT